MSPKELISYTYKTLSPYSDQYNIDRKRFLASLTYLDEMGMLEKGKRALDIGGGIGMISVAMSKAGCQVDGVDKFIFPDEDDNMFSRSDEFKELQEIWKKENITMHSADLEEGELPFSDNEFDVINFDATIEHFIDSPKRLFKEIHRILKPGGYIIVSTPNAANLLRRLRFLVGRSPNWDIKEYYDESTNFRGHRREFTRKELTSMLSWAGFSIHKAVTTNVFFSMRHFKKKKYVISQMCTLLSTPFPSARDMLYVIGQK